MNHGVRQNGGSTTTASVAPVSFQYAVLVAGLTWKVYLPGGSRFEMATRSPPTSVQLLSRTGSSRYLKRAPNCAPLGAEKFRAVKWISNCSFSGASSDLAADGGQRIAGFAAHAIHQHGFDDHRRRIGVGAEFRRVDGNQTGDGGEQQAAVARADRCGLRAAGTFARQENAAGHLFRRAIGEIRQRFLGTRTKPSYSPSHRLPAPSSTKYPMSSPAKPSPAE